MFHVSCLRDIYIFATLTIGSYGLASFRTAIIDLPPKSRWCYRFARFNVVAVHLSLPRWIGLGKRPPYPPLYFFSSRACRLSSRPLPPFSTRDGKGSRSARGRPESRDGQRRSPARPAPSPSSVPNPPPLPFAGRPRPLFPVLLPRPCSRLQRLVRRGGLQDGGRKLTPICTSTTPNPSRFDHALPPPSAPRWPSYFAFVYRARVRVER